MDLQSAKEAIYTSLKNGNEDIDTHIRNLKALMKENNMTEIPFESAKLAENNRAGRKMMQSYFKKRGVKVTFEG